MNESVDIDTSGPQRLDCGCTVEINYGSPLWATRCADSSTLWAALMKSPKRNARQCAERDALRQHIGMGGE
ncbi:hypothetical protein ACFUJU_08000 [Streptomyces sp. NPDC057235]|uniref:hypothetical protein n=1 Tax=Streptomyces sp. NPDC057235 TaxID=3346058 RepID=UPI00363BFE17